MFNNRLINLFIALALGSLILFTFQEASSTAAIAKADRSYDQIEQARANRSNANLQTDRSYDQIEALRLGRALPLRDQSYDQVETLRSQRGTLIGDRSYDAIENLRPRGQTKNSGLRWIAHLVTPPWA